MVITMNKEEIKIRTGFQQKREQYLLENKSKAQIINILIDTEEYVEQLETIIDKAIEYVEDNTVYFAEKDKHGNYLVNCESDELMSILKGEDNENKNNNSN